MKNRILAGLIFAAMTVTLLAGCGAASQPAENAAAQTGNEVTTDSKEDETAKLEKAKALYDEGLDLIYGANPDFDKAYEKFSEAAELGYNDAYYYVAKLYGSLFPTEKDDKKLEIYMKNEENPLAQLSIASLYRWSEDIPVDEAKADEYAQKAVDAGAPEAARYEGEKAYYNQDYDKYVAALNSVIEADSEQGCKASAMLYLASCYYRGFGVEQSYEKAIEWYEKAAELNNVNAMAELADKYMSGGRGVDQDIDKAIEWAEKAAYLKSTYALNTLGNIYSSDKYGRRDDTKSFEYYKKAADLDYMYAQFYTAQGYRNGKGVEKDHAKALEYAKKAAEHAEYNYSLGGEVQDWNAVIMLQYGDLLFDDVMNYQNSTNTTKEEILKWFGLARDAGNSEAIKYYDSVKTYLDNNM